MDYPNSFLFTAGGGGDFRAAAGGTAGSSSSTGHQQQQQQHLTYDFDYDVTQQRLAAAMTTTTTTEHAPPYHQQQQQHQHFQPQQQQQQRAPAVGNNNPTWLQQQQQVEQENQLLRQRLEQVQDQMQAAQQQCLILQQQQQQQDADARKRPAAVDTKRSKKRKHTAAAEEEEEEEETQSEEEEEEEEEDSDNDDEEEEDDDENEDENDDETTQHKEHRNNNNNNNKSTYGNRKDPIKTPKTGMIDGRSNATLAFEQKCNILRQFIAENGHANVPNPTSKQLPQKWQFLSKWIEKQFKFYRGMKTGRGTKHLGGGSMTLERAQMLKDLGINLDARTMVEETIHQFHNVHFPTLQQFHAKYGHCCVPAVLNIHGAATTTTATANAVVPVAAQFVDPEFKKWVAVNKVNLRNAKAYDLMVLQKQQRQPVDGGSNAGAATASASAPGDAGQGGELVDETGDLNNNNNKDSATTTTNDQEAASATGDKDGNQQQSTQKDGDEKQTNAASDGADETDGNNNNNKSDAEKKKRKGKEGVIDRADRKRAYWTDEMTQKLQSLNCPWMNEACENEVKAYFKQIQQDYTALNAKERRRRKVGASFQTFPILNTQTWYENVELFRKYVQEHNGNGLVPVSSYDSMSGPGGRLGRFVKDQRKLYNAIQAGIIPSHPIVEQNFAMLESMGFVFDAEILRKDEERRCQEKMNQARAAKEKDSPWAKLEQDKKMVQEANAAVRQARAAVNEAQAALAKAHRELQTAYKRVRDQEAVVANDPLGKLVNIKYRNEKKPGGRGRVLAINKVKIVQQDVTFYDVEYIDDDDNDKDKEEDGKQGNDKDKSSGVADDATEKVPRREYGVDGMFVTFEDARFNNNGNVVAVAAQPKLSPAADGPNYNLRRRRSSPQQQHASMIAPGFHNLMLPPSPKKQPGSVEEQTDDYEDGMSLCI